MAAWGLRYEGCGHGVPVGQGEMWHGFSAGCRRSSPLTGCTWTPQVHAHAHNLNLIHTSGILRPPSTENSHLLGASRSEAPTVRTMGHLLLRLWPGMTRLQPIGTLRPAGRLRLRMYDRPASRPPASMSTMYSYHLCTALATRPPSPSLVGPRGECNIPCPISALPARPISAGTSRF